MHSTPGEIALSNVYKAKDGLQDLARRVEVLERAEKERPEICTRREITDIAWDRTQQYCEGILEDDIKSLKEQVQAYAQYTNQLESWRAWAAGALSRILVKLEMLPGEPESH